MWKVVIRMAHIEKYTAGASGHMLEHYERTKENLPENVNQDKTYLNYNLAEHQQMQQLDFIHKRLSEVKVQKRKDVNILCDWVVTIPKDFLEKYPNREDDFFKETYKFLENKYGKENVVSAYVHRDEATPHLHFAFIPVVKDKKKDINKVSAKEAITRNDLKKFHPELSAYLQQALGIQVNILNEATKEGNKSIDELKKNTAKKEINNIKKQVDSAKQELNILENQIKQNKGYMSMYDKTKVDVIGFNELPSIVSKFIGNNMVLVDRGKIEAINKQLKGLLTKNHLYSDVLHNANIEANKILAKAKENGIYEANKMLNKAKKEIDNYSQSKMQDVAEREEKLNKTINYLKAEIIILEDKNKALKTELLKLKPIEKQFNDLSNRFFRLVEVTRAKELSEKQKEYINKGNITRTKSKGIEI